MAYVEAETAQVYRGGGRRFFTKRAAYRAAAKAIILARWEERYGCECGGWHPEDHDTGYYDPPCPVHGTDQVRFSRMVDRLARVLQRRDRMRAGEASKC